MINVFRAPTKNCEPYISQISATSDQKPALSPRSFNNTISFIKVSRSSCEIVARALLTESTIGELRRIPTAIDVST